ncbi:MAG: glucokinase [Methylococcales bacterium]|nr:glucokinase [Methylococcales bacterium]
MILVGDIGGTKTILALYEQERTIWSCSKKQTFASADFETFEKLLDCFLISVLDLSVQSVCIGVAGPTVNGDCTTTNLPWELKSIDIARQLGTEKVKLLNDLEATAWGVLNLPDEDFVELNSAAKKQQGNIAILAAGTGLGEALIIWSDEKHHVVATEGGHTDFAPRNELEIGLLRYLMEIYPDHVSNERVVCGQGLVDIYQYLKSINYAKVDGDVAYRMSQEDPAAVIGEKGCKRDDELCVKALDLFCEIYGAEAGNVALKCLPKAGVVLAGGIAAKILPSLQRGGFMQGYLAKGRYKELLKTMAVKVCLNQEAGLLGAVNYTKLKLIKAIE